jgi:outer membrane protein assembly factor BamD
LPRSPIKLHPLSSRADYAHYRIGLAYFKESPKAIDRDQNYLDETIKHLRVVIRRYPRSPYMSLARKTLKAARRRLAEHNFYVGRLYYRTGQYISCIPRFVLVAERYPDSGLADKALYTVVKASIKLDRLEEAKEAYSILTLSYPKSKYVAKAERKLLRAAKK